MATCPASGTPRALIKNFGTWYVKGNIDDPTSNFENVGILASLNLEQSQ
jgi:hypothetical protein